MTVLPNKSSSARTVILIPKQLRAEWMDCMALDSTLSHVAFRGAGVIGSHFNRYTGKTFLSQETIARVMGVSERTVYAAIRELEDRGYLLVKRRELGTVSRKTVSGEIQVKVAGGKGVANTYFPAFQRSQLAATNRGVKLATHCDLIWEQRSQKSAPKVATSCDPTLTPPSEENPSRAREPSSADALGCLAAVIRASIGNDQFRSWFGMASIAAETADALTLAFPTRFIRSEVIKRYEDKFSSWCQLIGKQHIETQIRPVKEA
jgi:DNA-binding Lrp family transcriptional regulator